MTNARKFHHHVSQNLHQILMFLFFVSSLNLIVFVRREIKFLHPAKKIFCSMFVNLIQSLESTHSSNGESGADKLKIKSN